jgi:hypothetical protein
MVFAGFHGPPAGDAGCHFQTRSTKPETQAGIRVNVLAMTEPA